ncbi:MAG: putative membrane protein [Gammaproteobacteria bacterium]|jgi:putative membrane protein
MIKSRLKLIAKGFCVGSADVVPGVSGGTMAFILGIYPQLINAIKSFDSEWLRMIVSLNVKGMINRPHFGFLIPLGIGAVSALLFFTRIVPLPTLIRTRPEIIYGLFFGLVLGSIVLLFRHLGSYVLFKRALFLILGIAFGGFVVTMVPASTPDDSWFIFLCGAIAISAMILPGISGSFILLMLKKYAYIFNAIGHFDFSIILPFMLGIITGVVLFSRILSFVLMKYYQQTILFITGLLIASLYVIWPFQTRLYELVRNKERLVSSVPYIPEGFSNQVFISIVMMIIGLALVIVLDRYSEDTVSIGN